MWMAILQPSAFRGWVPNRTHPLHQEWRGRPLFLATPNGGVCLPSPRAHAHVCLFLSLLLLWPRMEDDTEYRPIAVGTLNGNSAHHNILPRSAPRFRRDWSGLVMATSVRGGIFAPHKHGSKHPVRPLLSRKRQWGGGWDGGRGQRQKTSLRIQPPVSDPFHELHFFAEGTVFDVGRWVGGWVGLIGKVAASSNSNFVGAPLIC